MALLQRGPGAEDELGEILLHLCELLNTRQGASILAPDYGLPDSNDLLQYPGSPGRMMCRAIRQCLEQHEPRLQVLEVREQENRPGAVRLGFLVRVIRRNDRRQSPLILSTALDIGGRVTVGLHD